MKDYKCVSTPMVTGCNLNKSDKSPIINQFEYRYMIGSLLYIIGTRLDIVHAVGMVGFFQANLKETHLKKVKRIFKYLQGIVEFGLWYPNNKNFMLQSYTNVEWDGSIDD